MSEQDNGGPAFPTTAGQVVYSHGMTLRDWFAGQARINEDELSLPLAEKLMKGSAPNWQADPIAATIWWAQAEAKLRYIRADAMLAARGQP